MTELRFPLRGRGARRGGQPEPQQPLEEMAEQIRMVDDAARTAAERIAAAAVRLESGDLGSDPPPRADLLAGLAAALVERTEEIRADCERLSGLLERATKLVAAHDAERTEKPAPPATKVVERPLSGNGSGAAEPELEAPREPAPRPRWLSRRSEPAASEAEAGSTSEGVRLIATQMAIAGSSRSEIERRLRVQFGVVDASQALDEIFGNRRSGVG